jgi:hypothetical protein
MKITRIGKNNYILISDHKEKWGYMGVSRSLKTPSYSDLYMVLKIRFIALDYEY